MRLRKTTRGQATVETALALVFGVLPLTFGLIAFAEIGWTYHALASLTRLGARYAATHCFQDSNGSNVVTWMTNPRNAPAFLDRQQLATGGIPIQIQYWTHNPETHISEPVSCAGSCGQCVPDSVTVSIGTGNSSAYQFNRFLTNLGLPPVQVPTFATTVPMESGIDPETQ